MPRARGIAGGVTPWRAGSFHDTGLIMAPRPPATGTETATEVTIGPRRRLPNRHGHQLIEFQHAGIRYTAGAGRFEDGGFAEIFLNTAKHGTALDVNVRDAAVAASLLLQHGCSVDTLRQAPHVR